MTGFVLVGFGFESESLRRGLEAGSGRGESLGISCCGSSSGSIWDSGDCSSCCCDGGGGDKRVEDLDMVDSEGMGNAAKGILSSISTSVSLS